MLAVVIFASGCESSNPKRAQTTPPPAAMAPAIAQTPLPPPPPHPPPVWANPEPKWTKQPGLENKAAHANYKGEHLKAAKSNSDAALPRRRNIGAGAGAFRPISRDDLANPERRRRASGPDLSGTGGVRISPARGLARRRARNVAVHALHRAGLWFAAQLVGG